MTDWTKKDYQYAFSRLKEIIQRYYEHEYNFTSNIEDLTLPESIKVTTTSDAFDILLVITGTRPAMLFQSVEDQSVDQKGDQELQEVSLQLSQDLHTLIKHELGIRNIKVLFNSGDIWIYNKEIQNEVDEKLGTSKMTDILGYLSPFSSNFTGFIHFKYNGYNLLSFGFKNLTTDKIQELRRRLQAYRSVAEQLDGKVDLSIDFK